MPNPHATQEMEPVPPGGQLMQFDAVIAPVDELHVLAGHETDEANVGQYAPAGHGSH